MSDPLTARVSPNRPFENVITDFGRLFSNKGIDKSKFKIYEILFVCLWTKAVHHETVSDLTSEAFLTDFNDLSLEEDSVHMFLLIVTQTSLVFSGIWLAYFKS